MSRQSDSVGQNFPAMQTIKIFLGSSIDELHDERLLLGDYLLNSVRPIFKRDGVDIEVVKCEDIQTGYRGKSSQEEIDDLLRGCDISVFMFKTKAGPTTVHEYKVAQELVGTKKHEIYVYCFGVTEEEKEESLKGFKQQMRDIELYWKTCKDINDLEKQLIIGLLDFERQLLGLTKPLAVEQENKTEQNGDARFAKYQQNEQAQAQLREEIHKDIEDLLQQTKTVMANEDETIAARIFKVIELYKKADQWAAATAYDKEKYSHLLFDYAQFLYKYGLYKDAVAIYLRQIPLAEELYGSENKNTATSYNTIGMAYFNIGDYEKALDITTNHLGMEHIGNAIFYDINNGAHGGQDNYEKALEYLLKALAIREKLFGTDHLDTATSYDNIGGVYRELNSFNKALEYLLKALAIRKKNLGKEHPDTATSYNNIGEVYHKLGDYDDASKYYFKALAIREKILGTEHTDTATSYNDIGWLYRYQGDDKKALECFNKAYLIYEKALGTQHSDTKRALAAINIIIR